MCNQITKIASLLNCSISQLEDEILKKYFDWCSDKSYTPATKENAIGKNALNLELNMQDLQSLMADRALFNYFFNLYMQSMLDFLEDVEGMNPMPTPKEARLMYKNRTNNVHRFYNTDLMTAARNKKIQHHVKN